MSHHFSFFKGVPEWDEDFDIPEVIDWFEKSKKALLQNSCEVTKRTVVKKFSIFEYNRANSRDIVLFVSTNPFLCTSTISIQYERNEQNTDVWTDTDFQTNLKITYPLNLFFVKHENSEEYMLMARKDYNSLDVVNDVLVICEIIEFPRSALNLFSELI